MQTNPVCDLRKTPKNCILHSMRNITTYYIRRANPLVWISACLMLASIVLRVLFFATAPRAAAGLVLLRLVLPVVAGLVFLFQLFFKGRERLCVTAKTIIAFMVYFLVEIAALGLGKAMGAACVLLTLALGSIYYLTYAGRIHGTLLIGLLLLAHIVMWVLDPGFGDMMTGAWMLHVWILYSDAAIVLSVFFLVLATRERAPRTAGEPWPYMLGDRPDGRLIRSHYPMENLTPYFLGSRGDSGNLFGDQLEISNAERYIRQKRREGLKHFGMLHIIIGAYVRACAEFPGINRFIAGQRVFARRKIEICINVKKTMALDGEETIIKVLFDPADTADDIYSKFNAELEKVQTPTLDSGFDKVAGLINYIPGIVKAFMVWLLKVLDYFGLLPEALIDVSPFHTSIYITALGSLGIPPVYHHMYNFGAMAAFGAFGAKRTVTELDEKGEPVKRKYIDITWNADDRIVDGYYYAAAFKRVRNLISHPERLDQPPEKIVEDDF